MARLVNCTPHSVTIYPPDTPDVIGDPSSPSLNRPPILQLAASDEIARVQITDKKTKRNVLDLPIHAIEPDPSTITGLPPSRPDTYYIVSRVVAKAARAAGRTDVITPHRTITDYKGRIVGCRAWC